MTPNFECAFLSYRSIQDLQNCFRRKEFTDKSDIFADKTDVIANYQNFAGLKRTFQNYGFWNILSDLFFINFENPGKVHKKFIPFNWFSSECNDSIF